MANQKIMLKEEGLNILEEGIWRAKRILTGIPPKELFTSQDFMKFYNCVYCMCTQRPPHDYSRQLYERFNSIWEESIFSVVLPSLENKHDTSLLVELLQMWENYKVMVRVLSGFFLYLEDHFIHRRHVPSLNEGPVCCFREQVCNKLFGRFQEATISLINQERNGKQIDQELLRSVLKYFVEIGDVRTTYYETFEKAMLEDAGNYYSRLALELLHCNSCTDYIQKVECLLIQEKERGSQYFPLATLEKLLQVVTWQMIGQTANILTEKQNAESLNLPTYEDLLSRYANMSL